MYSNVFCAGVMCSCLRKLYSLILVKLVDEFSSSVERLHWVLLLTSIPARSADAAADCERRLLKWHEGNQGTHGSAWAVGDVIGFAVDMRTAGAAIVSVSVNGSFAAPNGPVFAAIGAPYLSPALSASGGSYRLNLGDRPFAHAPPGYAHYVSVHVCHQQRQQHQEC